MPIRNVKMDDRRKHHHFLSSKHGSSSPSLVPIMSSFIFDDILACHSPPTNFYTYHGAEYQHCRGMRTGMVTLICRWSPHHTIPPGRIVQTRISKKSVAQSYFTMITFHLLLWSIALLILILYSANQHTRQFSPVTDYLTKY